MSPAVLLTFAWLLFGAMVAAVTIDVGASAIDGEWRPTSCDDVKHGVVLTNISDGVRAVIKGCTIAVDAGSDATKSAVSIAGLGENSTVELIGCNVTATFSTSQTIPHGAVCVDVNATLGNGSKLLIDSTSVSMEDSGTGSFGGAVLFDDGITAGDGFQLRVSNESTLTATSSALCFAVGSTSLAHGSVFGRGAVLTLEDSALYTHSTKSFADGLYLRSLVFQEGGAVSVTRCSITGTAKSNTYNVFLYRTRFEKGSVMSIADSTLSATTSYINNAYGVNVQESHFGNGSAVKIAGCNISATAKTSYAYSVHFSSSTFERGSAVSIIGGRFSSTAQDKAYSIYLTSSSTLTLLTITIDKTELISAATFSSAALALPSLSSSSVTVTSSVLSFNGSAPAANSYSPSGAIVTASSRAWSDVKLSVSSSSFASTDGAVAAAPFILWPENITGVSPQSFDNVTFSGDDMSPFEMHSGGEGPGSGATLCFRDVRWSNGTAITAGPAAFTAPSPMVCWPPLAVDVGTSAIDGVWRPASCDDVKGGVVLTNISDGVRAVIEGCTIAVDAGSDATKSAVSIAGLGENSSVELIGCNVTAVFNTGQLTRSYRHGTVRVEANATLGIGSKFLIRNTTVSMVEPTTASFGGAVLFDEGVTTGDEFQFAVSDQSTLSATCDGLCFAVGGGCLSEGPVFGPRSRLLVEDSALSTESTSSFAHGLYMRFMVLREGGALSIARSSITGSSESNAHNVFLLSASFEKGAALSITDSNLTTTTTRNNNAFGVYVQSGTFGNDTAVSISRCNITATAKTSYAYGLRLYSAVFASGASLSITGGAVTTTAQTYIACPLSFYSASSLLLPTATIRDATLFSAAKTSSAALVLPSLSSTTLTVSSSVLQFDGSASGTTGNPSGAIVTASSKAWSDVQLAVSSTTFVATNGAAAASTFVLWPKTITGVSPQSFDNVTFSGDGVAPFSLNEGGAGIGPNTTLCLRDVRWSNGTAITEGPAEFTAPSPMVCWPPLAVDVGTSAIDGVWRPASCDDVKGGVVLTNISDGVRAVIEGCTIAVDAGSDATTSAVSIAGLGENSSVEFIGCNVTATFSTTTASQSNRHGAVRVEANATLGNGSKLLIDSTAVSMEDSGTGSFGGAVLFDDGITAGDGFQLRVSNASALTATSSALCFAVGSVSLSRGPVFGRGAVLAVEDSVLSAHSTTNFAHGLYLRSVVLDQGVLSITRSSVSASSESNARSVFLYSTTFENGSVLSIADSTLSATTSYINNAYGVYTFSAHFGNGTSVEIAGCNISVTAKTSYAYSVYLYSSTFESGSAVSITGVRFSSKAQDKAYSIYLHSSSTLTLSTMSIHSATLISAASFSSAALVLPSLSSTSLTVSSSVLQFNGSAAAANSYSPSGAIVTASSRAWSDVHLAVSSSSVVATDGAAAGASFLLWPENITGVSPQSFDNVTFSGDGVAPFSVTEGGAGPGPNTTLCLRDVRWSNGTAITEGPAEFTAPSPMVCWPPLTVDVGASAIDGVWRPTSCDDVKDGVVLTNISDGVRAVIEGCAIAVDAGSDATKSAVSIAGLGENSSVELIGCTIKATFSTTTTDLSNRHGTVRVQQNATLGNGSRLLIDSTAVLLVETGVGQYGGAVLFDDGVTAGEGFLFRVSNESTLTATCDARCFAVGCVSVAQERVFGRSTRLALTDSAVSVRSKGDFAFGLYLHSAGFGAHSVVSIRRCNVTTIGASNARSVFLEAATFEKRSVLLISDSTLSATTEYINDASGVYVKSSGFGSGSTVSVSQCNISATARTLYAFTVYLYSTNFGSGSAVSITRSRFAATAERKAYNILVYSIRAVASPATITIDNTELTSTTTFSSAALVLPSLSSSSVTLSSSVLSFNGSAPGQSRSPTGAIAAYDSETWTDVQLSVSSSSVASTDAAAAAAASSFVLWPKTITGVSPQSFDNVTFSGDGVAPFRIHQGGAGPGPNTTLCLRDVRWSNGTAIDAGPPEFTVSKACQPTPTPSSTLSAPVSATLPATRSAQLTPSSLLSASPNVSASRTAAQTKTPPATKTKDLPTPPPEGPTEPPRAVPAVAVDSTTAMESVGGISGVVSPLTAGVAVRVATSARASECEVPSLDDPPAPWPLVAKPLGFLGFGLTKTTDAMAYEDTALIWANFALFLVVILLCVVMGVALYFFGSAGGLPGHELRVAAVARLRPGSSGQAAWVAAIATVQVLGGLLVAVVGVLQVPATAAAVSILGNHALIDSDASLVLAGVTLVICTFLTAAPCVLCVVGYRSWASAGVPPPTTAEKEEEEAPAPTGIRRVVDVALDNGAEWEPAGGLRALSPVAALGFAAWCHVIGDARGPEPKFQGDTHCIGEQPLEDPFLDASWKRVAGRGASPLSPGHGALELFGAPPPHPPPPPPPPASSSDSSSIDQLLLLDPPPPKQRTPLSARRLAPWRHVAISGAWWLGLLEPLVSFLSGVATGMARAGFCTVGPWAALVLQFVYVMVLVLTWPIKAPALLVTMIFVQLLQLASLALDMGLELAGLESDAGGTVEAVADWTALVVAVGLASLGVAAVAVRLPLFIAWVRRRRTAAAGTPPLVTTPPPLLHVDAMLPLGNDPHGGHGGSAAFDAEMGSVGPGSPRTKTFEFDLNNIDMTVPLFPDEAPADPFVGAIGDPFPNDPAPSQAVASSMLDASDEEFEHPAPAPAVTMPSIRPASSVSSAQNDDPRQRLHGGGKVVVEKGGQGGAMAAELEALLGSFGTAGPHGGQSEAKPTRKPKKSD